MTCSRITLVAEGHAKKGYKGQGLYFLAALCCSCSLALLRVHTILLCVVVGFSFGLFLVAIKTNTKLEVLIQGLLHR